MECLESSGVQPAAAIFFDEVARRLLARHSAPDLREAIVLLPNYHAAQPLARALAKQAQKPALLLPAMVTLNDWARSVQCGAPIVADSQRNALLYQHLRKQKWFGLADLWGMTRELLALFDELTHALDTLPGDAASFAHAVEQAYQARQNAALQLEARLVFELWHAMQSGGEIDEARASQQRLATLAEQARQPLYVLRASAWTALEQRFLDEYGERAQVEMFDLREMGAGSFLSLALAPSFSREPGAERDGVQDTALRDRAARVCAQDIPRLGQKLRVFAATSLEQEARAAAMQVRRWLQAGKRDIAIVAQDRVVARRMRALLERAGVLVADEAGWTFATLSVSTVLERWLTALQSDFYHHDLLDLLKSPFIFCDMPAAQRKGAVYRLEQLLRKQGVVAGLENFIYLTEQDAELGGLFARLRKAAELLEQHKRHTLAQWLKALRSSLAVLGIEIGLQQDDAGAQMLHALETWQQELAGDDGRYRFVEWRRWLAQQLDTHTYVDTGMESPVRFTHLAATRWRAFDAVLLLGCDADHLPSAADGGRWFNDAVRASLNLPTRATHAARQRHDLCSLLTLNDCVLVTWQKDKDGEERLLSPFLEMLRDLHELAFGDDLTEHELQHFLAAEEQRGASLPPSVRPAPGAAPQLVPASASISAYNSLVACPYQFYARHVLRLNELDEVPERIEKRDYGEHVHEILRRFHQRYPQLTGRPLKEMNAALGRTSELVFASLLHRDFSAHAWLARWFEAIPAYLEWQIEHEAQGWRYAEAESAFAVELDGVRLTGRIDRIDTGDGDKRVLDYKTQPAQKLKNMLHEPGEDVQLACYAYAHGAREAAFVSLDGAAVKSVAPQHDVSQLAQLNAVRLTKTMERLRHGAALPANGIDAVCRHCEMRGLCRKGEWGSNG